jgi:hypothetical protein
MFRALGARLTLETKGVAGVALFEAAAQRTWLWGTIGLKTATELFAEGELQEGDLSVNGLRYESGNRSLCRVAVHRPDTWDPSTLWRTTVDLVRTGNNVEIGVAVEQDLRHQRVPPSPLQPPLMALLHDLVESGAAAGSQRVRATAESVIGTDQIEALVQRCLLDPGRRLPVVLFSSIKEEDGVFPADAGSPTLTARELCGLAHVYVMPRVEDSHRLTKRLRLLSVYDGAVRIYWPRLRLSDPPPRHPLHLRQRLNTGSGPAIIRRVVEAGARSYRPPDGTATLLASRRREQQQERIAAITSDPDPVRQASLLREELLRVIDANVVLEHEMDTLRHQLARATSRSNDLEVELSGLRSSPEASTELTGRPATSLSEAAAPEERDPGS